MVDRRMQRLILLVNEMKRGKHPNCESFARRLAASEADPKAPTPVSPKTVSRDIHFLMKRYHPPMAYDAASKGYVLVDTGWSLPGLSLEDHELFAALFSNQVSEPFLPAPVRQVMDEVKGIELAAGENASFNPGLLDSLVIAAAGTVSVDPGVAHAVLQAWKQSQRLRITYASESDGAEIPWEIDIHALFLFEGAWYARASCPCGAVLSSFALHRMRTAQVLETRFVRSAEVVAAVRAGHTFDHEWVQQVRVVCAAGRAAYFREREWFPGQGVLARADGALELTFPSVPAPLIEQWVMSAMGAVTVIEPPALRQRIGRLAAELATSHGDALAS